MESALQRYVIDGGIMMVVLVPLALLTIAFSVQAMVNLRRARVCPKYYADSVMDLLQDHPSVDLLVSRLAQEGHSLGRILARVLEHLELKGSADPAEALREEIDSEAAVLEERNSQLAIVYTVAPLVGLLGTVLGMISTFREFTSLADPSVQELSEGIFIALITTAWGLGIAIPAFLMLGLIQRRIATYERIHLPTEGNAALQVLLRRGPLPSTPSRELRRPAVAPSEAQSR